MRLFYSFLIVILISSCTSSKIIPIQGNYPDQPIEVRSDSDFEVVWSKLVDIFAQRGLSIKIIDKSSGLIISDRTILKTTIEDEKGRIQDSTAYIVIPTTKDQATGKRIPVTGFTSELPKKGFPRRVNDVSGDLNVRVKRDGNGTVINVNLVNIKYDPYSSSILKKSSSSTDSKPLEIRNYESTGVFENWLASMIK